MFDRDLKALFRFIGEREAMPHAWGRRANDCGGYALGAVEAQTGRVLFAGRDWTSERGAIVVLGRAGGFEAAIDGELPRIPTAMAMWGDVAGVTDDRFGIRLMIVEGDMLVGPGPRGNRRSPRSAMIMAWSAVGTLPA